MNQDDDIFDDEDDELDSDEEFEGVYVIDDATADLLASAIGIIQMTAGLQLNQEARDNLHIIADAIQERFAIEQDSITVEEQIVTNPDTGEEEILYKPKGGVFGDEEEPEAEGPAPE